MAVSRPFAYNGPLFDVQAHAIEPSTFQFVCDALRPEPVTLNDTTARNMLGICENLADSLSGSARTEALGRDNIQVVTVNTFFPRLPADRLLQVVDDTNGWMARSTANRSRLIGTAAVAPPPHLAESGLAPDGEAYAAKGVESLRRAISELHLQAVMLSSNYDGIFLGHAAFDPYFALAQELAVPVIIHPAVRPVGAESMSRQNMATYAGYLNDQRTTLLEMVMAGTLDRYPNLTIIATHLGGGILTSLGRFSALQKRFPRDTVYVDPQGNKQQLRRPVEEYLKRIYYDSNNANVADVRHAVSVVGPDRLLVGTDFPWTDDAFTRQTLGHLDDASLAAQLAYGNAAKLFGYGAPVAAALG